MSSAGFWPDCAIGRFLNLTDLNTAIDGLLEELNNWPMRQIGKPRRQMFDEIERDALAPLPSEPFEYAEWKITKGPPALSSRSRQDFYSMPHRVQLLILDDWGTHTLHDQQLSASRLWKPLKKAIDVNRPRLPPSCPLPNGTT